MLAKVLAGTALLFALVVGACDNAGDGGGGGGTPPQPEQPAQQ